MRRISDPNKQKHEILHERRLREIAPECTLYLKKDGTFPIKNPGKIALYGNGARHTVKGGTGSGDVNVREFINIETALEESGFIITSKKWLDSYDEIKKKAKERFIKNVIDEANKLGIPASMYGMGKVMPEPDYELETDAPSDIAIYILSRISGEGNDRTRERGDILLTESEERDILVLNKSYKNFLLVLNTGGMVDVSSVLEVKNILLLGQLGSVTGYVLSDILLGKSYPSGKLAMTWADIDDYPSTKGFGDINDTYYSEGIYVGYRYFNTTNQKVMFPFGYGLSNTDFKIEPAGIFLKKDEITVKAIVKNVGSYPGREVVEAYIAAPQDSDDRPSLSLAGFTKTDELEPGESKEIVITLGLKDFASYDEESSSYLIRKDDYPVCVGNSSLNTEICGIVRVGEDVTVKQCVSLNTTEVQMEFKPGKINRVEGTEYAPIVEVFSFDISLCDGLRGELPINEWCQGASDEDLIYLCLGNYSDNPNEASVIGAASSYLAGGAGETTGRVNLGKLLPVTMADGPAGLRLSRSYTLDGNKVIPTGNALGEDMTMFMSMEEKNSLQASMDEHKTYDSEEYYQYCTAIPIGTDLAQTFNPKAVECCGDIVGSEMELFGVSLWLAPAMNIQRNPLCGRNFEYYSEDPYLSGIMAGAMTKGVQAHRGCGVTIKHYAANNQETNRYASNSIMSEKTLREIYLKGYEICIREASPVAVMTAYNLINGEHVCNSSLLIKDILRDEFGFKGIVMTDWYATLDMMKNPQSKHPKASAPGCIKAGNDLVMPGTPFDKADIEAALLDDEHPYHITRHDLEKCAGRVYDMLMMYSE